MVLFQLICFGSILLVYATSSENLVALIQIFRHGERIPVNFYPNDPFKSHWKDLELEEVTNEGRRQMYTLGQLTRAMYEDWIPKKYSKNFIRAQTTDVDRTHVSGQSYLYGLFPAIDDQKWISNSNWQAIPLHPADPKILWVTSSNCAAYDPLYNQVLNSDYFIKVKNKYSDLYNYLSKHTGNNISDLYSAQRIHDTLKIEAGVGLTLPDWTKSVYPEPLTTIAGIWLKSLTYTTQTMRLYTGSLLNEIIEYFETITVNSTSVPKLQVYSGHDDNIAAILNSFGCFDPPYILEFGSSLWIELRNRNNSTFYLNVWLKNGEKMSQIQLNNCELDCPLKKVKKLLKNILVDVKTWTKECNYIQK